MIIFKKIRYKNFLSSGDNFTEINLNNSKSTLIVGQNGSGKSTMLDALSFVLFGKAHRNINKPQLINSINQKNMLVEVEFTIGNVDYTVFRGMKPNVFEIWRGEELINQDSHNKDYQKVLEQNILKLNHKSFHQIIVLGSSSFVPFMQLPAQHRREVIEDLLDINVFSKMNQLLKEKSLSLKEEMKSNDHAIEINYTKIVSHKKYINDIQRLNDDYRQEKQNQINDYSAEIKQLMEKNVFLNDELVDKDKTQLDISSLTEKVRSLQSSDIEYKTRMKGIVKEARFYENNETCPTCEQNIQAELKERKLETARDQAKEIQSNINIIADQLSISNESLASLNKKVEEIRGVQNEIHSNNKTIERLQKSMQTATLELSNMNDSSGDLSRANHELEELCSEKNKLQAKKFDLNDNFSYNQVIAELLKDTGIKTKIIKQYLPVMNKLINQFLQILDFYVLFDIDETFKETIKSRHRDIFSYESFSEGEKQRIDLALLFTWRMIAKMKNSIATNLLVLDETFDSSLDTDGVENLTKILDSLGEETNVFVISHKGDMLEGKFDSKIEFVKHKNFSKVA